MSGKVAALAGVELPIETLRHKVVRPEQPDVGRPALALLA
jgi:hypothetical protein